MPDAETSLLTHIALVFNAVGHGILRALTTAGIGLVLLIKHRRAALLAFILAEALTPLLVNLIKLIVGRERPSGSDDRGARLVLPLGSRCLCWRDRGDPRSPLHEAGPAPARLVARPLPPLIAGMAWSRTYLHAHWLSDAVAGAILGVGVALLSLAVVQILSTRWREGDDQPLPADRGERIVHLVVEVRVVERLEQAVADDEIVQAAPKLDEQHVDALRVELLVESLEHVGGRHVDIGHRLALDDDPADVRLSSPLT